jgi:hypothetical protein
MKKLFALLTLTFAATVILAQPLQVSFTPVTHNGYEISCFGGTDGSVTANPSGGTPPYTYKWSTMATTQTISNLPASYYAVTVTDANLNTATNGLNMREPQQISVTLTSPLYSNGYNVSCYQCYNGSITNTVSGGVSSYSYLWNGGVTTQNRSSINGNTAYTVTVTDGNGCTKQGTILISEPARSDWTMTGNTGSNPATNYIGTTDNVDLVFKTNGVERIKLNSNGGIKVNSFGNPNDTTSRKYQVLTDATGNLIVSPPPSNLPPPLVGCVDEDTWWYQGCYIVTKANVGIGTYIIPTDYKLAVKGKIIAEEMKVQLNANWPPDYVFEDTYKRMSLKELEDYVLCNKHLPHIPSASEMKKEGGFQLGNLQMQMLQTAEEQALFIIDLQKQVDELKKEIDELKKLIGSK